MAIIGIPKKKTSSPIVKEKRKAGTRAGLTKREVKGPPRSISISKAALGPSFARSPAGAGRRHPAVQGEGGARRLLGELLLRILEALHARPAVAKLVVLQLSSNPVLSPLLAERLLLALAALGVPTEARECFGGRWASSSR